MSHECGIPRVAEKDGSNCRISASISDCTDTTSTSTSNTKTDSSFTRKGHTEKDDAWNTAEDIWVKAQGAATETLRSQFGDTGAKKVAGVVLRIAPKGCPRHRYSTYGCCEGSTHALLNDLRWACLVSLYPRAACQLDEIATWKKDLLQSLNSWAGSVETYAILTRNADWDRLIADKFDMSSTDARWEPGRVRLEEVLEELEDLWASLTQDLDKIGPEFDKYLEKVRSSVEDTIQSIRNSIFKLDWKRDTVQEALQRGVEKDPPSYKRRASEVDEEKLPNPYRHDSWYPVSRSNSPSPSRKVPLRLRTHILWGDFKRRLGSKLVMCIIMAVLCTAGLITNILSVLKWTASDQTPTIDSNFWSVLSQSNIGIAAIYSVIIPQLQTGQSPVARKSQWLFNGFLGISVLTALLATMVYPWHGRTSIVAAFVSCTTQLAVTLQMILSAGAKIQNLEMEITQLGGHGGGRRDRRS